MHRLEALASWWGPIKIELEAYFGLSPDAMHIHVGMLVYLGFALVLRRRVYHWMPWLLTLLVECTNEFVDLFQPASLEASVPAGFHDLKNTMFLPTVMLVLLYTRNFVPWLRPPADKLPRRVPARDALAHPVAAE